MDHQSLALIQQKVSTFSCLGFQKYINKQIPAEERVCMLSLGEILTLDYTVLLTEISGICTILKIIRHTEAGKWDP
jgi:hypothetical protein